MAGRHSFTENSLNALNTRMGRTSAAALAAGTLFGVVLPTASAETESGVAALVPLAALETLNSSGISATTADVSASWALEQTHVDVALSAQNVASLGVEVAPLEPTVSSTSEAEEANETEVSQRNERRASTLADSSQSQTAQLSASEVTPVVAQGTGSDIVNYALQFVGAPYRSGGTTPSGWDCSGFVGYVYAHFGVATPRTSGAMRSAFVTVSAEEARPGDLVWWPGHVGIYAGNGMHVAATNPSKGTAYQANYGNPTFLRVLG